jgi:hypothetical protein
MPKVIRQWLVLLAAITGLGRSIWKQKADIALIAALELTRPAQALQTIVSNRGLVPELRRHRPAIAAAWAKALQLDQFEGLAKRVRGG